MTSKAALCLALLEGRVLNVSNCFKEIGLSNIGREVPRMIEKPFGVTVSRQPRTGKSRYGQAVSYTDYRLNRSASYNQAGMILMREYVKLHYPKSGEATTDKQKAALKQQELFLNH